LLPAQTFSASFYSASLDALVPLKSQWQVSIGAMISRAAQLNLISEFEERRMWINLNRRNWRKREPLDDQLIPEEPRFLVRALELIVSNGLSAPGELSIHLGLSERIIEEVLGLEIGYLSKGVCPPVRLKDEPEEPETHILRFPTAQ
jgi:hypothetical protein